MVEDHCTSQGLEEVGHIRKKSLLVGALVVWVVVQEVEMWSRMVCVNVLSVVELGLALFHKTPTTALDRSSEVPRGSGM